MANSTLLHTVFFLCTALTLFCQNPNRPIPANIPAYEFVLYDSSFQGYYLTAPFRLTGYTPGMSQPAMILDSEGYLFWYMPVNARNLLDFRFNPDHQLYQYVKFQNQQQVWYILLDTNFHPVDSFTTIHGIAADIHDFQISRNNTFLLAGASDSIMDLSAYQFDGIPGSATTHAIGFVVQELDANHKVLFQWDSNDHIHPGDTYAGYGYRADAFDYCHGNSIEEDSDGNLLLSFRNLDAVYKISRQTGEILWQLGGKTSSFAFTNDAGFSGQHDVRRLPNGNIALFDNANMASPPRISRAVEYQLDTADRLATKVWEYRYSPPFFSPAMGSHQTTPDRRHLINYGLNFRPDPSFVLIDDDKNRIAELFFADSVMSYRSSLYQLPLGPVQRPAIACAQSSGIVALSAPPGYAQYAWSTGETTASITAQASGTYQVWVKHGAGMLGSEPFHIQDLNTACAASGVSEAGAAERRTVVAYYDLLGRPMAPPQEPGPGGRLYVVRYADGRVELRMY